MLPKQSGDISEIFFLYLSCMPSGLQLRVNGDTFGCYVTRLEQEGQQ